MVNYRRLHEEGKQPIFSHTWKRMKADTRDMWNDWRKTLQPVPRKKDVNLLKYEKPGWKPSETENLETLNQGGFGTLHLIENKKTHKVALERVLKKNMESLESFKEAVQCLKICKGESCFLQIIAVSDNPDYYSLYLEHFDGLALNILDGKKMEAWMVCRIVQNIGKALRCLHSRGILHRQVHGSNIFVNERLQVKLTGFEIAKISKESDECVGIMGYMAPEVIAHNYRMIQYITGSTDLQKTMELSSTYEKYGMEADYFSLGVILFDLFIFNPPAFSNLDNIEPEYKDDAILFNMYECNISFPSALDTTGNAFSVFKTLTEDLLNKDPKLRPAGKKLKKHAAFSDIQNLRAIGPTFVDLQQYTKPISEIVKSSKFKVIHNARSEFLENTNTDHLEETFLHLATRPESFPVWQNVLQIFYSEKYRFYKASWDMLSRPLSTLSRSTSLGFSWTTEGEDSHRSENLFPTPIEASTQTSPLIQLELEQTEEEDLEINSEFQYLQMDSTFLIPQTSSSSAVSFHTPATRCSNSGSYCFCCSPDNGEDEDMSVYESTTDITEAEDRVTVDSTPQEDFFISLILWISFITLCIIFLGKSIYSVIAAKMSTAEGNASEDDENSEDESDCCKLKPQDYEEYDVEEQDRYNGSI